tara:strand:- start:9 stop:857 length:849 start_codon:yes stop_codon:yes gene_type:complete
LEEVGIEDEELSDGYEFMGGSSALNDYINKNARRLVVLMGGEIEDEILDKKKDIKKPPKKELDNQKQFGFLFEQFENIESKEKQIENVVPVEKDIYTMGGYLSLPIILSQTTKFFDRGSASISGFNVVTPFKLEKLGRILEALTKAKSGILSPNIMFEIRAYYFEKVLSDSVKEVFGGSSYFHVGFYDKIMVNGRETDFSFLVGKTHFNSIGFILTNGTQIPLKLKNKNLKLYLISKTAIMHKFDDKYTGWVDLGISVRYDINTSKITKSRGLIKRRQTIIK